MDLIAELKKNDYWIIGLDSEADKTLDKFDIPKKSVFVLGSEHSGLRELTKIKKELESLL